MRNTSWVIVVVIVGLLIVGCSSKKVLREKDARIAELEGEMSDLEAQLAAEQQRNEELNQKLEEALAEYKEKQQVWLEKEESRSVVTVSEAVLFNSGSTTLSKTGIDVIDRIAEVAGGYPDREIIVEGHTDDVGIAMAYRNKYPSNWELSAARASAVVRYLMKKHEMDPARLAAVGYGEYRPIADNETPEGRAKNRRVVLKIGPVE